MLKTGFVFSKYENQQYQMTHYKCLFRRQLFERKIEENNIMVEEKRRPRYWEPTIASRARARPPRREPSMPVNIPKAHRTSGQMPAAVASAAAKPEVYQPRSLQNNQVKPVYWLTQSNPIIDWHWQVFLDTNRIEDEEEILVMQLPPNSFTSGFSSQNNNWNVWSASISPRSMEGKKLNCPT